MNKKYLTLFLTLCLLLGCFAGCGKTVPEDSAPSPTPEQTPEPTPTPTQPVSIYARPDYLAQEYLDAYAKFDPDTVVLTVNGLDVLWQDYFSWLYTIVSRIRSDYEVTDWNDEFEAVSSFLDNPTYAHYAQYYADGNVVQCAVISAKARELNISLSEEDEQTLQENMDQYVESLGGEEAFEQYLNTINMSKEYFLYQNELIILYNNLYTYFFGENGEKVSEEDAVSYAKDNGYLYAKHILFSTVDEDRNLVDEMTAYEQEVKAKEVFAQLQSYSAEELPEKFEELMLEYNEDPGMASYPDGYYFQTGEMVPEFEDAVVNAEENGLYLVSSDYGFHIIFCPPMHAEHIVGYDSNNEPYDLRSLASVDLFNNMVDEWYQDPTVVYAPGFENLDLNALLS